MSELYLVLRSRLDAVPEWVFIDPSVLTEARQARGLSYETMAREIHVSSKTWERYEKAGRIPRPLLGKVAETLGLEIEEPMPRRVTAELDADAAAGESLATTLARVEKKLDSLTREASRRLAAVERELGRLQGGRSPA